MIGGLFFVPMVSLLGILIAWYRRDPRRFLDGPAEDAPAVGLGREYRLAGNAMVGAALVVEETVAHLMVFPARYSD